MKAKVYLAVAVVIFFAPLARAQDFNHVEVGAFADYFRLQQTTTNFVGAGGRAAFNVAKHVQIEGEMSYDFGRTFTETFSHGVTVTDVNSTLRILHGLAGLKLQTAGPLRLFVTAKGGAVNFRFDSRPVAFGTFTSSVDNLRSNDVDGAFYPGGGVEAFIGPIGLRLEVGDEMIFTSGVHHNWKASIGPQFRF